jgi:hypothetical protein
VEHGRSGSCSWLLAQLHCLTFEFVREAPSGSCQAYLLHTSCHWICPGNWGKPRMTRYTTMLRRSEQPDPTDDHRFEVLSLHWEYATGQGPAYRATLSTSLVSRRAPRTQQRCPSNYSDGSSKQEAGTDGSPAVAHLRGCLSLCSLWLRRAVFNSPSQGLTA